jgi:tetratricopeptide (TPR) repeat protein
MAHLGKHFNEGPGANTSGTTRGADQNQIDFELDFFAGVLQRVPDYVDVLRLMSKLLTIKGRYAEGLQIDRRLVQLCATDALAHYNLACRYARLKRPDQCLKTLRRAVELGYRDFRYMREDQDLDAIRHDPRFRQLLREYEAR